VSTAQDLPLAFGEPSGLPTLPQLPAEPAAPVLRLVPDTALDFEAAVRSVRPRLHRYATRRLGDAHEAEELVQEALLRAYSHRDKLQTEDDLAAWSTVVTGRLVIDRLRTRGRSLSVAEVPEGRMGPSGRDTADVVVARDEARTALDALDAMPARQAALLWAREVEGDSYEDLCVRFGMTEPAVRSILTRARKSLRKEYATRGGTLPVGGLAVLAPWLAGLTWAARARHAAHRITAPVALATVGITALGGLVLAPFGVGSAPSHPAFAPHRAVIARTVTTTSHAQPVARMVRTAAVTPAAPAVRPIARTNEPKLMDHADLPCTGTAVESVSCAPQDKGAFVSATVLPDNPVVHRQTGVTVSDYDCAGWRANPVITCTPGGADR
jgi:RNA polymerase sigma-70 factor (ECF subfamily)